MASDFVGIAECEQGGLGLCRVAVCDSWKGLGEGERFSLKAEMEYIRPTPILALAGRKYLLLCTRRDRTPPPLDAFRFGYYPTSLSRRQADYSVVISWRMIELSEATPLQTKVTILSQRHDTVAALRSEVLRFLAQSPEDQEKEILQSVFIARLPRESRTGRPLQPPYVPLATRVLEARNVEEVLALIFQCARRDDVRVAVDSAVRAGGRSTLQKLLYMEPAYSIFPSHIRRDYIGSICQRNPEWATNLAIRPRLSTAGELRRMQNMLGIIQSKGDTNTQRLLRDLRHELRKAKLPGEIVHTLHASGKGLDARTSADLAEIIMAGGEDALRAVESYEPGEFGLGPSAWAFCRNALRLQLGMPLTAQEADSQNRSLFVHSQAMESMEKKLQWARETMSGKINSKLSPSFETREAFAFLTLNDPGNAVDWLVKHPPEISFRPGWPRASLFAGYFVDYCRTNRVEWLKRLLQARNADVRAIAASVLADDDPATALPILESLRNSPGSAGDLACFQLARRGDKIAMDRVAGLLKPAASQPPRFVPMEERFGWPIASEIMALLSNCAKINGLPPPGPDYAEWWKEHRDHVRLVDPWLSETRN